MMDFNIENDGFQEPELPAGWALKETRAGKVYYFNAITGETQHERPEAEERLSAEPGSPTATTPATVSPTPSVDTAGGSAGTEVRFTQAGSLGMSLAMKGDGVAVINVSRSGQAARHPELRNMYITSVAGESTAGLAYDAVTAVIIRHSERPLSMTFAQQPEPTPVLEPAPEPEPESQAATSQELGTQGGISRTVSAKERAQRMKETRDAPEGSLGVNAVSSGTDEAADAQPLTPRQGESTITAEARQAATLQEELAAMAHLLTPEEKTELEVELEALQAEASQADEDADAWAAAVTKADTIISTAVQQVAETPPDAPVDERDLNDAEEEEDARDLSDDDDERDLSDSSQSEGEDEHEQRLRELLEPEGASSRAGTGAGFGAAATACKEEGGPVLASSALDASQQWREDAPPIPRDERDLSASSDDDSDSDDEDKDARLEEVFAPASALAPAAGSDLLDLFVQQPAAPATTAAASEPVSSKPAELLPCVAPNMEGHTDSGGGARAFLRIMSTHSEVVLVETSSPSDLQTLAAVALPQGIDWAAATRLSVNPSEPAELFLNHPVAGRYTIDLQEEAAHPPPDEPSSSSEAEEPASDAGERLLAIPSSSLSAGLRVNPRSPAAAAAASEGTSVSPPREKRSIASLMASPAPSLPSPNPAATAAPAGGDEQWREWSPEEVGAWLSRSKLHKYAAAFVDQEISGELLKFLDGEALAELGVGSGLDRARLQGARSKLPAVATAHEQELERQLRAALEKEAAAVARAGDAAEAAADTSEALSNFLEEQCTTPSPSNGSLQDNGRGAPADPSGFWAVGQHAAAVPDSNDVVAIREQIAEVFVVHNPGKLAVLDGLLAEWQGEEAELLAQITEKYVHTPISASMKFAGLLLRGCVCLQVLGVSKS